MLASSCPAIPYSTLYTKQLEYEESNALKIYDNYNVQIDLSCEAKQDLAWWIRNVNKEKSLTKDKCDVTIYTDASRASWGGLANDFKIKGR